MKVFEFVLILVGMIFIFQLIRHRLGMRHGQGHGLPDAKANGERLEADRLREELKQLKERMAVIERITVEKENSLAREIEDLRSK